MRKISGQAVYVAVVLLVSVAVLSYAIWPEAHAGPRRLTLRDIPFNGTRAYSYLRQACGFGPRPSGSKAMSLQRQWLAEHFKSLGAEVSLQSFTVRHPLDGSAVPMANVVARWHPDRPRRVFFCAHYDTRPFPDRDPHNRRGKFVGANDGASGVAVLMELAKRFSALKGEMGVDVVLFDGEEFMFEERGEYFLGSTHFAREYVAEPPAVPYEWGVLLDMVGDSNLRLYQEENSVTWTDTRPLVQEIWGLARRLGVHDFIDRTGPNVRDDHLPLHEIAKLSVCDIIDFDYPFWHTQQDSPEHCSALSLAKVGWVLQEWLERTAVPQAPADTGGGGR
ncbi:MAG TPA: M28 family peptidase [Pirellulales bacterium]|nr:M28 family peptidase [Pirellulales bacterium]